MPSFWYRPPTYLLPSFPAVVNDDVRFKCSAAHVASGTCGGPDVGSGEAIVGEVCISQRSATSQGLRNKEQKTMRIGMMGNAYCGKIMDEESWWGGSRK